MAVDRAPAGTSLIDVLDRVLDKGIVVDGQPRGAPAGIGLAGAGARIVVVSVDTDLRYVEAGGGAGPAARRRGSDGTPGAQRARSGDGELRSRLDG